MKNKYTSSGAAISLEQAMQRSNPLAQLIQIANQSNKCLEAVLPLIPPGLRTAVAAGPLEDGTWCMLVGNNAAAAKMRQLLPALLAHLRSRGWEISAIRLKVQVPQKST